MDMILITNRRREVEHEIAKLRSAISEMESELAELTTAERVIARLSGVERGLVSEENAGKPKEVSGAKPDNIPTMPEMIGQVLATAHKRGLRAMTPKDIAKEIAERFWPEVNGEAVSSISWRMWKRDQLVKVGDGLYALPNKDYDLTDLLGSSGEKPAELASPSGEQSAGLSDQPASAGEPGREVVHDNMTNVFRAT